MLRTVFLLLLVALSLPATNWKLVWSDEFDKPGPPDPSKWTFETGFVRNREAQYYTNARPENARVENGLLVIEARKELFPNPSFKAGSTRRIESQENASYTSASLTTEGKASWSKGRIEVRAKLPTGRGSWPAIWMLGVNCKEVGWPRCGEIDIMENVGYDPDLVHANIHTDAYNHVKKTNKGNRITIASPYKTFHVYAVEWDQDRMDFFVDSTKYFTYVNEKTGEAVWPFDQPFYLILNLAIGGTWGGSKGIDDSVFPQRYEIDYVRVYQR